MHGRPRCDVSHCNAILGKLRVDDHVAKPDHWHNELNVIIMGLLQICPATKTNPVSICGFCSENHAGVRLMIQSNTEQSVHSIDIEFHCDTLENEVYNSCTIVSEVYGYIVPFMQ